MEAAESNAQKPALPVSELSAPRVRGARVAEEAAPNVNAAGSSSPQLIALSAAPAPTLPPVIPAGNLSSRVAISPQGGVTGASARGGVEKTGAGPPGLSITGGTPNKSVSALGDSSNRPGAAMRSVTAAPRSAEPPNSKSAGVGTDSLDQRIRPGAAPETLLGDKRIYTLHVNMPNLTSAAGSWILSFAELAPPEAQINAHTNPADLAAPEPLRKVDPKYPPELRSQHVEGEVVLYAVIRADGSVDSIQLVRGIDAALNANAMQALAQWRFRPAERKGEPVELETIVHIPFRAAAPAF